MLNNTKMLNKIRRKVIFWYQRITKGVADEETLDMFTGFSKHMLPRFKKYKELKIGHPAELNSMEEWDEILDKIIWSLEQTIRDWELDYLSGNIDINWVPTENGKYFKMEKGPNDTFKVDEEGIKKHQEKIQEGLDLLSRYYLSLWW